MTDEQLLADIEDKNTATVAISKDESEDGQVLTYFESMEIASTEDFLRTQELQAAELPSVVIEEPQETII